MSSQPFEPLAPTFIERKGRLLETEAGALAGTPLYMSPEQAAASDDLDERSDVYSLCILFYEWLTLRHPLADMKTVPEVLATLVLQIVTEIAFCVLLCAKAPRRTTQAARPALKTCAISVASSTAKKPPSES